MKTRLILINSYKYLVKINYPSRFSEQFRNKINSIRSFAFLNRQL